MAPFVRRLSSFAQPYGTAPRVILLVMASVLLLSGCMLSPLFQAPAALMTGIAVLLGLAACGGSGGGGGGGGGETTTNSRKVLSLNGLTAHPELGVVFGGDSAGGLGRTLTISPASFNNTGYGTLAIGQPGATNSIGGPVTLGGRAYLVFGNGQPTNLQGAWNGSALFDLTDSAQLVPGIGMAIYGTQVYAYAGNALAVIGSINGDAYADVIVGADRGGVGQEGGAWAVFGASNPATTYLGFDALGSPYLTYDGSHGFKIYNSNVESINLAASMVTLDLNGDGEPDLVMGNPGFATSSGSNPSAIVTFGPLTAGGSTVLNLCGASSTYHFAAGSNYYTGRALAKGHVHGDGTNGIDDLVIGSPVSEYGTKGVVHVVFGNSIIGNIAFAPVSMLESGATGFIISYSGSNSDGLGYTVAVGDVNGDGMDDILIADNYQNSASTLYNKTYGRVWVVFGRNNSYGIGGSSLDLATMTSSQGFSITLPHRAFANSLAVGDVNGDGVGDILIGSPQVQRRKQVGASTYTYSNGGVYVVFGQSSATHASMSTSDLDGTNGFLLLGRDSARMGFSLAVGELTGDDFPEIAIGAPSYYSESGPGGRVILLFGVDTETNTNTGLPDFTLPAGNDITGDLGYG